MCLLNLRYRRMQMRSIWTSAASASDPSWPPSQMGRSRMISTLLSSPLFWAPRCRRLMFKFSSHIPLGVARVQDRMEMQISASTVLLRLGVRTFVRGRDLSPLATAHNI